MNVNKNDQKTHVLPVVKSGNKVQIGLPVLCNYDDDEDEEEEQITKSNLRNLQPKLNNEKPRSGLLGLLPPPKSTQNPFVKTNPKPEQSKIDNIPNKEIKKETVLLPRTLVNKKPTNYFNNYESDSEDEDNLSARKKTKFDNSDQINQNYESYNNDYNNLNDPEPFENSDEEENQERINNQIETTSSTVLDQETILKLCGSQVKRDKIDISKIADVNAKEIVGNNRAELMKQITSDYRPPSNKDYFGSSSRRTHQITYLAKVAVERDQELRNTWAQNKFNRQQAKQRYGF